MCGIYGEFASNGVVDNDRVVHGSVIMQSRGRDSFGYVARTEDGEIEVSKDACDARTFFERYPLTGRYKWIFCHTRGASHGSISRYNAHPFEVGDIIGLQNGFLFNHNEVAAKVGLKPRAVDSHVLIDMIDRFGDPDKFSGLWWGAIVYFNKKDGEIHIRDNTFVNMYSSERSGVTGFASTSECLERLGFRVAESVTSITMKG